MDFPLHSDDRPLETGHRIELPSAELVELLDGTEAVLVGDLEGSKDYFHKQGQNDYGFEGTCGLTSCGDVLNQFGVDVTENDVVKHAIEHHDCLITPGFPETSGATTVSDQAHILSEFGVPAHVETGMSLESMVERLANGYGAIIEVNAGELWNDAAYYDVGQPNHAITLTGVAVSPEHGSVEGIWVNDSGRGDFARYLPAAHPAVQGWISNGGIGVVTDFSRTLSS